MLSSHKNKENKKVKSLIIGGIHVLGVLISIWILFIPFLYSFFVTAAMIIPVISLIIYRLFYSLIKIDEVNGDNSISGGLLIPGLALLIRTSYDYEIYDYSNLWFPSLIISLVFIIIMTLGNKEFSVRKKDSYIIIAIMFVFSFVYASSSIIFLNCYYDKNIQKVFEVDVISKKSRSKGENYKIEVSPWGERIENETISLDKDLYYQVRVGDKVNVVLCKGKFDIPWFYLDQE